MVVFDATVGKYLSRMSRPRAPVTRFSDVFTLRLPDGMRDELAARAEENARSTNSEIVLRLQESLSPDRQLDAAVVRQIVREELAKAVEEILAKK